MLNRRAYILRRVPFLVRHTGLQVDVTKHHNYMLNSVSTVPRKAGRLSIIKKKIRKNRVKMQLLRYKNTTSHSHGALCEDLGQNDQLTQYQHAFVFELVKTIMR